MGNCMSGSVKINAPKITVLQAAQGRVVDMEVPLLHTNMKVGELLLEFPPGHFLAQLQKSDFLQAASTGKRASPLGADADAKPGTVYVLLPMPRLRTRITPQELLNFAELLHLHNDQQSSAATKTASKVAVLKSQVHGFFTAGARVAPVLTEEDCRDDNRNADDSTEHEQAIAIMQQNHEHKAMPSSSLASLSYGQFQVNIKSQPWAPKLETIQESSSL